MSEILTSSAEVQLLSPPKTLDYSHIETSRIGLFLLYPLKPKARHHKVLRLRFMLYYMYTSSSILSRDGIKCTRAVQSCDGDCPKCSQVVQYCGEMVLFVRNCYRQRYRALSCATRGLLQRKCHSDGRHDASAIGLSTLTAVTMLATTENDTLSADRMLPLFLIVL